MGALDGRVVIITGAGRGIGREHALLMASEGAKIVVNDLGGNSDGTGSDAGPAQEVVDEIKAMGGEAVANTDSVTSWEGGQRMVNAAVTAFGDLHVLVNNAGILRDRVLVNMTEGEWDAVIDVHLKGHFVPSRWAAAYWREKSKELGGPVKASIINTASGAMLGNGGQTNYTAAKAGIAAATLVMAQELGRYGVRANCLAPVARTRLTLQTPGLGDVVAPPEDPGQFDKFDPANVSPLVAYLATADCPFTGGVFHVGGNEVGLYGGWSLSEEKILAADGRWTVGGLQKLAPRLLEGRGELASVVTAIGDTFKNFGKRTPTT
jgi:NAD(P)-dependent dehydrogenase (short-subunit alcohol dehydrogenase family)